ncbi:MAG: hypothetical protein IPM37_17915 [Hahellaceae bacterium]|nr:hypothetical protein [Hahellaceae bacterium]
MKSTHTLGSVLRSASLSLLLMAGPALAGETWGVWYGQTHSDSRDERWHEPSRPVPLQPQWGSQYRWQTFEPPRAHHFGSPVQVLPAPPQYLYGPPRRGHRHHGHDHRHGHHGHGHGHHKQGRQGGWGSHERHH